MIANDNSLEIWVKSSLLPIHKLETINNVKHLKQSSSG